MINRKFDDSADIDHILLTEEQIADAVSAIAAKIDADSRESERDLLLLGILKGSVVFMGQSSSRKSSQAMHRTRATRPLPRRMYRA